MGIWEEEVSENPEDWKRKTNLWKEFEEWHDANPHVWRLFVRFAAEAIAVGRSRFSARTIIHRIRWYTNIELQAVDEYKINNNWSPYYARIFISIYPQYGWIFELREVDEDPETERRIISKIPKISLGNGLPEKPITTNQEEQMVEQPKLFNLVKEPKVGQCEARRCKNKPSVVVQTDAFERPMANLCTSHNEELDAFLKANPDYKYAAPSTEPQSEPLIGAALQADLEAYFIEGGEILELLKKDRAESFLNLENATEWLKDIEGKLELIETGEKEVTGLLVQKIQEAFAPAKDRWLQVEKELKDKIAGASAE